MPCNAMPYHGCCYRGVDTTSCGVCLVLPLFLYYTTPHHTTPHHTPYHTTNPSKLDHTANAMPYRAMVREILQLATARVHARIITSSARPRPALFHRTQACIRQTSSRRLIHSNFAHSKKQKEQQPTPRVLCNHTWQVLLNSSTRISSPKNL